MTKQFSQIGATNINEIYNENCLDTMKRMEDNIIDLVITSPPYDNIRDYNGYDFNFEATAKELHRVVKEGEVIVWIVADTVIKGSESGTSFRQALYFKEIGFNLHDTMIWEKDTFSYPDKLRYRSIFEYMFILSKGKPKTVNLIEDKVNKYAGTKVHGTSRDIDGTTFRKSNHNKTNVKDFGVRNNIWKSSTEKNNIYNHPAVFPEILIQDHILSWSNEGDIIYDCFMGSGTTAKMAILNNRNYIGSEISEEYCNIADKRIKSIKERL